MLFPIRTQVPNKNSLKTKFSNFSKLSVDVRAEIKNNIDSITITNILRESTINIEKGKIFDEIAVLEIKLKTKSMSDKIIKEIDAISPRNFIYVIRYEDKAQLAVSYKEKLNKEVYNSYNKYKIISTYRTEWKNYDDLEISISGLNIDEVFNNILSQVSGGKLEIKENVTIKESVEKSAEIEKLKRKIQQIDKKIAKELQFNRQIEMKKDKTKLENELNNLLS